MQWDSITEPEYVENSSFTHYFARKAREEEFQSELEDSIYADEGTLLRTIYKRAERHSSREPAERHLVRFLESEKAAFDDKILYEVLNDELSHYLARRIKENDYEIYLPEKSVTLLERDLRHEADKRNKELKLRNIDRALEDVEQISETRRAFGAPNTEKTHLIARNRYENDSVTEKKEIKVAELLRRLKRTASERGIELSDNHLERATRLNSQYTAEREAFGVRYPEKAWYAHALKPKLNVDPMDRKWQFSEGILTKDDLIGEAYESLEWYLMEKKREKDVKDEQIEVLMKMLDQDNEYEETGQGGDLEQHIWNSVKRTTEELSEIKENGN